MTMAAVESMASTVSRAQQGDEAAFARIVEAHYVAMTRVCFVVCGDLDLAEEAVQAAWPIAWRHLPSLRDPGRVRPWLIAVAVNEARALLRRRRRRSVREIPVDNAGLLEAPDPQAGAADIDLANALQALEPADRSLLALRYVAGMTSTELSQAVGLSPSGTRARLARLLRLLRTELRDG